MNPKGCFRLGQLHISMPKLFFTLIGNIGSQQITTLTQLGPLTPCFQLLPDQFCSAIFRLDNIGIKKPGSPAVLTQKPTHTLGDCNQFVSMPATTGIDLLESFFNPLFKTFMDGFFFLVRICRINMPSFYRLLPGKQLGRFSLH